MEDNIKLPEIAEVQRVRLEPGDRVIVRAAGRITPQSAERISKIVSSKLGVARDSILVTGSDITVEVVSQP